MKLELAIAVLNLIVSLQQKSSPLPKPNQDDVRAAYFSAKTLHKIMKFYQILKFMNEHITALNLVANNHEP